FVQAQGGRLPDRRRARRRRQAQLLAALQALRVEAGVPLGQDAPARGVAELARGDPLQRVALLHGVGARRRRGARGGRRGGRRLAGGGAGRLVEGEVGGARAGGGGRGGDARKAGDLAAAGGVGAARLAALQLGRGRLRVALDRGGRRDGDAVQV